VVNIGLRQAGRERSTNVLDVSPHRQEIQNAIKRALSDEAFLACVQACANPYGDGKASQRILEVLSNLKLSPGLLQKQLSY
jgi:UDP-N-acetylglucosamine 2-epimerase (non-hydrolysing)/GDP/UDP-N,N'-diacetylbacillosamine 2-epimerase (hydrolysing)